MLPQTPALVSDAPVAVVAHCAGHGWPWHATSLASTLRQYLMTGSHVPQAETIYGCALQAARGSGDVAAEAEALNALSSIDLKKGHSRDAAGHYKAALQCYRQRGDRASQARVLSNLGMTEYHLHDCRSSAGYYWQAIAAYEEAGDHLGTARALASLAAAETELGCYDEAAEHLRLATPLHLGRLQRLCCRPRSRSPRSRGKETERSLVVALAADPS